jgi:hypothetical protein
VVRVYDLEISTYIEAVTKSYEICYRNESASIDLELKLFKRRNSRGGIQLCVPDTWVHCLFAKKACRITMLKSSLYDTSP